MARESTNSIACESQSLTGLPKSSHLPVTRTVEKESMKKREVCVRATACVCLTLQRVKGRSHGQHKQ
jgi:hypothetical protein